MYENGVWWVYDNGVKLTWDTQEGIREWSEKKEKEWREKIIHCDCGSSFKQGNKSSHKKSKKHQKYIASMGYSMNELWGKIAAWRYRGCSAETRTQSGWLRMYQDTARNGSKHYEKLKLVNKELLSKQNV